MITDQGHHGAVIGIVGWKNNGKTTLVVRLVEWLTAKGLRVSTVKHAHHMVDIDKPGKDSYRHREAGATEAVLATSARFAIVRELRGAPEPSLDELLACVSPVDLVLVEGFKRMAYPKIEVHLAARDTPLIAHGDANVVAVATDARDLRLDRPILDLNDTPGIGRFILATTGLRR